MGSRKWRVESGELGSGEWRVASGEWRVASGEWRVASGEWRVGRRLATNHSPLATNCGFTLIELLISLTIFSLVAVVVYGSFYLGIRTWRKNEADLNTYQMVDFCFNKIRKDFGRIVGPDFSGSANEISFLILSPISPFEKGGLKGDLQIKRVKYFVETRRDAPVLIRNEQRLTDNEQRTTNYELRTTELLDDADEIKFSYKSSDGGWSSQWTGENLPRSVKVEFKGYSKVFFVQIENRIVESGE